MNKFVSLRVGYIFLVLAATVVVSRPLVFPGKQQGLIYRAGQALSRDNWEQAKRLAEEALVLAPTDPLAIAIAGIACAKLHDVDGAVERLEQRPGINSSTAFLELGKRYLKLGRLMDAEESFRQALKISPRSVEAHRRMSLLLSFEGRCAEAAPHLLAEVQSGDFRSDQLCLLGIPDRIIIRDESLRERCEMHAPDDPLRNLGLARIQVDDHHPETAKPIVERVIACYPQIAMAHGLLGRIHVAQDRDDLLLEWHESLPPEVTDDAGIWFVRSLWARKTGQTRSVVRCLLEVLKSRPNHVEANYQLGQTFQKLGEQELALKFSQRSLALSKLEFTINDLRGDPNEKLLTDAVAALEKLGRGWEAIGWCQMANQWLPAPWVAPVFDRLHSRISRDPSRIFAEFHPLNSINIDDYPQPTWQTQQGSQSLTTALEKAEIRFSDDAEEVDLDFTYFNSMNSKIGLEHIFQTTGGGAAAVDFDLDSWPDLYFANGRELPETSAGLDKPQTAHRNALFRNQRGERFTRVDSVAMSAGDGFGQGVAAGDFDNDGFPDIYVCNVGRNRLYHNNGDGTFSETLNQSGTEGNAWTMSAMIADVDGDGLSDIYAVNYLEMNEVFERSCKRDGQPLTCAPTLFSAEQDRLYRNLGNGDFEDVTEAWGIVHPDGKGLGIVGFSVEGKKGLQLFIANDTTENLFYQTGPAHSHYQESAVLAGLAMSSSGTIQACMGVAAGDANLDGAVDLFVTNFFADSNTMYTQLSAGVFTDATQTSSLAEPSYAMVGFGTQFLDADLDGWEDLIVTNGHVDQTFATGEPDLMPPQFYHNIGEGQFAELSAGSLGDLFQQKRFGRSLVRIDWNGDQKDDACIVHLNSPVALATNRTSTDNRSLVVQLKGVVSARDAVGSLVTLVTTKKRYSRQLTAGDGYQASNERKVSFGVPLGEAPVSLQIQWPNGEIEESNVSCGHFIAVQGNGLSKIPSKN
ncbi:MAG: FG-GAP-like repeat-containing protein [Fuerstiella sp.]